MLKKTNPPDIEFILAYVPDFTGLNLEEAAAIAIEKDEEAADNLESDFVSVE